MKTTQTRTMTVEQAAEILGISRSHAYAQARLTGCLGQIPVIRIGRRLVVPTAAVERAIAGSFTVDERTED